MSDSRKRARLPKAKRQLRGVALEKRIETVIRNFAVQAQQSGRKYVFNASQIARGVPTTRKTLARHNELLTRVLDDLGARRRMVTGEATVEHLREQLTYLTDQLAERDKMVNALRAHHIEIYQRFHANSMEAALLIRPVLEKENAEAGKCLLCGTPTPIVN